VSSDTGNFEQVVLPHLDAPYNLARWLVGNMHDAENIVQEDYLRAFKHFGGYTEPTPAAGYSRSCAIPAIRF
jgi:DNA-directed RNA polymerase specialized sigma24 family protein